MNRIFLILVIFCFQNVLVFGFRLNSNVKFHSSNQKHIELNCDDTVWDEETIITFYSDKEGLLFASNLPNNFPLISGTRDNKIIILLSDKVFGWEKLFCIINSVRSSNKLTIPYIENVHFRYAPSDYLTFAQNVPSKFYLNKDYILTCDGYVKPNKNVTVLFRFDENRIAASVEDGQQYLGNVSRLFLTLNRKSNNSVEVRPTVPSNYGKYYCSLQVSLYDTPTFEITSPESWSTEGTTMVPSKILTKNFFYTKKAPEVGISCSDIQLNSYSEVVFFTNFPNQINTLLYNSSSSSTEKFPYVSRIDGNTRVILNSTGYPGWNYVSCSINRTKNVNQINVPYLSVPEFHHSPKMFQLNQTYTFTCPGFLWPNSTIAVRFMYNRITYATMVNGNLTVNDQAVPGLSMIERIGNTNDTITVIPEAPLQNGTFSCMFLFYTHKGPETVESELWETYYDFNGTGSSTGVKSLVAILIAFAVLLTQF